MAKVFVSGRTLMSSSIQFMSTNCKTGAKRQTTGHHKISRHHHRRASVADLVNSDAAEGPRSTASCATKPVGLKAKSFSGKSSKSKTKTSMISEPTTKESTSTNLTLLNASKEIDIAKSTAEPRREPNKCKAANSFSAAYQNRGKTFSVPSTSLVSKKHASIKVPGHQVQGCQKVNEKKKIVTKTQRRALGDNLNGSSVKHLRCTRRAAKTASYTIRCGQRDTKSTNEKRRLSRSSRSTSVTLAAGAGRSVSPYAHLIPFPKISLLKLTRRAAATFSRDDSSATNNVTSTNSHTTEGEVVIPEEESLGPASYMPTSSQTTSISNISSLLDTSESKPRLKKLSRGGVVRTRIVRKKKTPCYANGPTARISQTGMNNSALNPCDGGKLDANQAISVVFNDSNRFIGTDIDAVTPGNAAFSLASSSELMKSCPAYAPYRDLATSVSDSKTNSHKRRTRASGEGGCYGRHKVHVTRIRRSLARPPRDSNNNANSSDEEDPDEKSKTPQKKITDSETESKESSSESSRTSTKSSQEKDSLENSSSPSLTPVVSAHEKAEPAQDLQKMPKKGTGGKRKKLKFIEPKVVKTTPIPKCPLFQGWDMNSELGEHSMTRLPNESDLVTQLTKRAKYNIWEAKGRPHNILSMVGSPTTLSIAKTDNEDLKSYLARHSILEFAQHLTNSVLVKPDDESVVNTLMEQGQYFKQTLKYETDTDAFLKYVFRELGDQPIAFPSVTKSRNIEPDDLVTKESPSHTPVERRSCKRSFEIVIGIPGLVYDPRLSARRLSARSDLEHRNTLQVGYDRPYFDTIRNNTSADLMQPWHT